MINEKILNKAERYAIEFLTRLYAVQKLDETSMMCGTRETGALRRTSMELTRALAELRRSRFAD